MTYLVRFGIAVVDVDAGEDLVKAGPVLRVDDHLVLVEVHVDLFVVLPNLHRHLQQLAQIVDVHLLQLEFQLHFQINDD